MKLKLICLLAFLLYFPSLFNYFSHDDFFNLGLAKANSVFDFIRLFDPIHAPERLGSYRPLTTQAYFLVSRWFFLSPIPLHLISFFVFFLDIFLVYKLAMLLLRSERASLIASFLYATSATHFAHLYWPSIFQELGLVFFFLASVILFLKKRFLFSFLAFIGALMSKETAVMIPIVLGLMIVLTGRAWRRFWVLVPFCLLLGGYLFVHLVFYGLPPGSVYVLDLSTKVLNTFMWYVLWAFNLPELLVDYIGPGLRLNQNLILFYGGDVAVILLFFIVTVTGAILSGFSRIRKQSLAMPLFLLAWFGLTLAPVILLPWHKFTYELGVPLVGMTILLGWLLAKSARKLVAIFCLAWLLTSVLTLQLTQKTHWIVLGAKVAQRVERYFQANHKGLKTNLVFYDTAADKVLPWSPANELKLDLSNNDFFDLYYPGRFNVSYLPQLPATLEANVTYIGARQFLGY